MNIFLDDVTHHVDSIYVYTSFLVSLFKLHMSVFSHLNSHSE